MDSQRFRNPTYPKLKPFINEFALQKAAERIQAPEKKTIPIDDVRYPGFVARMNDARIITDYKSHCANNVAPSKYGNSIRGWLQQNADGVIQVSRNRQAARSGALFYRPVTVPGAKQYQKCDEFECKFSMSGSRNTVGLERKESVPELFGTFGEPSRYGPTGKIDLTTSFEGGRNTPRGRTYVPLGLQSFNPRNGEYGSSG